MKERDRTQLFFWISFLLVFVIIILIFLPLINTILLGMVFAFVCYPVYKFLYYKTGYSRVSAFIICALFVLIVTIPIMFAVNKLAVEIFVASDKATSFKEKIVNMECPQAIPGCVTIDKLLKNSIVQNSIQDLISEGSTSFKSYVGKLLIRIPALVMHAFIILFMMYYLMIDGYLIIESVKKYLPIRKKFKDEIFVKSHEVLRGILFGNIIIGIVQGALAAVGFFIFGVDTPLLWGILVFFFSFLPVLGTGIIWLPISISVISEAAFIGDVSGMWRGVGLFIFCAFFVSTIDNFIRPRLLSDHTKIHPILVLFGVIGGISVFDAAGVFIGPLIIGIFITLIQIINKNKLYAQIG